MAIDITPETCKVALIMGGSSGEREVSLSSGKGAKEALEAAGFPVTVIDSASKEDLKTLIDDPFDVAFLCLHGKYGEDGTMQGFLEIAGIPYIGSGVWSSSLAIDKVKSKEYYRRAGIQTPPSVVLTKADTVDIQEIIEEIGSACVVKVSTEGSALGVYIVNGEEEIRESLTKAFELDDEALVEKYIEGDEYTVAILGNDEAEALPVIQIVSSNDFYDFDAKYSPGGSRHICPAPLSDEDTKTCQGMALGAHKVLECRGVSRSDIMRDRDGKFWLLETNTIPGMTATSLLPDAGRAAGIEFPELCTRLIAYALEK